MLLGVNIDHIATLRQARGTKYPDPINAALITERAGADSITVHLREDRRHIQDRDVLRLKEMLKIPLNLEMAITDEMITFAELVKPMRSNARPYSCITLASGTNIESGCKAHGAS